MLHLGCVAHQFAKWQVPPEKWACTPDAVSGSTGSAGGFPCRACLASEELSALHAAAAAAAAAATAALCIAISYRCSSQAGAPAARDL
jgi:hypothetical protein